MGWDVDAVEFSVYRYLSPDGVARFWAGRRVLDPRITPREVAGKVGISESSVRTRLQHLEARGFLRDRTVTPNPALFGKRVYVSGLPVRQPGEVDRILRDLSLVEGVIFTRDVLDEDEREIQVHFLSDGETTASRLSALVGRLATGGTPVSPRAYYTPPCDRELTRLDWRVLYTVWHRPDATIADLANATGISVKTAARSYHQLIDSHACWWSHGPGSEEFPLALVTVGLKGAEHRDPTVAWIAKEAPAWMPVASDGFGLEPEAAATVVAGLVPADLPAVLERFVRRLAAVDGVSKVRRTFALGTATYASWFGDRIAAQLRARW